MNKNLKKVIAIALAFGTVSALTPATNINLLTTKAYAKDDDDEFNHIKLLNDEDHEIRIYEDDDYDSNDRLDDNEITSTGDYYIKTSSKKIKIHASGNVDKDRVKVFKGTADSTKGKDLDDDISISGDTTITIRVYDEDVDNDTIHYDDTDYVNEYTIDVNYTSNNDNSYDNVYLEELKVNNDYISLSKDKTNYSYDVSNNVNKVTIKAAPEYDNDDVTINGYGAYEDNNFKREVSLNEGSNEFKIKVKNDDDVRDYTLTINRAKPINVIANTTATVKANQWVQVNGFWQYNDSTGNPLKNQWFFDRNYGKWYYLGSDGKMLIGWIIYRGKYYFLYPDGSMAASTTVGNYKLDADGAWIGR